MHPVRLAVAALVFLIACHDATGRRKAAVANVDTAGSGSGSAVTGSDGSGSDSSYTPSEFKSGMARWKDTVVYLDGRPIGWLDFGELPVTLKPDWVKDKVSTDKPPGCPKCPAWKWGYERFYRFTDYLKAMGIDIASIKQIHVQGPKELDTIVATGKDLMSPAAKDFTFRFGEYIAGKAIPHVPDNFGNGEGPDKITAVMIYVHRTPPTFDDVGYVLDGKPVDGVPYYGEPARGGIRVYFDDKLVAIIKRNELDVRVSRTNPDGQLAWNLYALLQKNGVDTSKIVEGYTIRDQKRMDRIPASELSTMWFEAASQSGKSNNGSILLGDKKLEAQVIALHSHALTQAELDVFKPRPEEL